MNQPKKIELKRRVSTVKKALIEAGKKGMQVSEILAVLRVDEPNLTRDTLAAWVASQTRRIQAVRGSHRAHPGGYTWYHRGADPKAPAPTARRVPAQGRVITITLPSLPRITPLRVYAVGVTVLAATLTALEVL